MLSRHVRTSLTKLAAALAAGAALLAHAGAARAQTCNPFSSRAGFVIPPLTTVVGDFYVTVNSLHCPNGAPPNHAGLRVTLPQGATTAQKCQQVASALTRYPFLLPDGGAPWTVVNNCTPDGGPGFEPSLIVSDNSCTGFTGPMDGGAGLFLGITNDDQVLSGVAAQTYLIDYELDEITPGCASGSGLVNVLSGIASGTPINPGTTAGVLFVVDLTNLSGGALFSVEEQTTASANLNQVVQNGVADLNFNLGSQTGSLGTTCAVNATHPRAFTCTLPSGAPVQAEIELNDTGLRRLVIAGSSQGVAAVSNVLPTGTSDTAVSSFIQLVVAPLADGGVTAQDNGSAAHIDVNGVVTVNSTCGGAGGPACPALDGAGTSLLWIVLGGAGLLLVAARRRSITPVD
jgi:hypothetical protein